MAQREVKDCGSLEIVEKEIDLQRRIPLFHSLEEVENERNELSRGEYLAVAQSFNELALWNAASWEEKELLCPILGYHHNYYNAPILLIPKFEPLCGEVEANRYEESDVIEEIHTRLGLKKMEDYQIGKTIERIYKFCEDYDLDPADVVENLSNIGWHPKFGCRIIDYGLSNQIFYNYTHWGE